MIKAAQLAGSGADIEAVAGNAEAELTYACGLGRIGEGGLTFVKPSPPDSAVAQLLAAPFTAAVVCDAETARALGANDRLALLVSKSPRLSFMKLLASHFGPDRAAPGVDATARVHPTARIDENASVGAFCYVGPDCVIGSGSVLHPSVVLYGKVTIGRNVAIHSGTVIGADGFGYERSEQGELVKFPHIGGVVIEDDVEIGSNTSIDRGTLEDTFIGRGAKIDNQIHIAHNCRIGEDAVVIAQSMVGGSVKIGARAWLAPAAVVMNQVSIGADALVGLGAVVTKTVADGQTVMGAPAAPEAEFKATRAALKALIRG